MEADHSRQINWNSSETSVRINPRLEAETLSRTRRLFAEAPELSGHVWVQSSGSTKSKDESDKWIALSKKAFLVSAEAVNRHLDARSSDVWGICLPTFHVSGLSIKARSFLSGSKDFEFTEAWEARRFVEFLVGNRVSLLSLVPAQLFDLVEGGFAKPAHLRAIVLGGARLEQNLYDRATAAGWPVLPSFGMTEFCSQVATARSDSADLHLLSHIEARTDAEGTLSLKSESLFTGFLQERFGAIHWDQPALENGFWRTPDRALLRDDVLEPLGRSGDYVKIKGEGVNLTELRSRFEEWRVGSYGRIPATAFALTAIPDARDGSRLVLAIERGERAKGEAMAKAWNERCFPIERLQAVMIDAIPRSSLGKVLWGELNQRLNSGSGSIG